ncbi:MAG TPA: DUF4279 domain-containing protein [Hanamia sp.]|nr:DUF4279 domain-containing protein [Hanamia sp.]
MKYLSQSYVYLAIFGESFIPNEFSKLINITPTKVAVKGENLEYTVSKECFWEYKLEKNNALEELDLSLNKLMEVFKSKTDIIRKFMLDNNLEAKCNVVIEVKNNEDSGVFLSSDFIIFLESINASVEVNTYNY